MPASEIMRRFYAGALQSSSGAPVKKLAQAKAIAASYGPNRHEEKRMKVHEAAKAGLGEAKDKPEAKHPVVGMHVKKLHSGGYHITHTHHAHPERGHEEIPHGPHREEHGKASMKEMLAHLQEHMPEEMAETEQGGEQPEPGGEQQ